MATVAALTTEPVVVASIPTEMKVMDANRYATKKTIAQGMLDIALLTANASQLRYVLQIGERHEFYKLMLILISLSIIMQVLSGILSLSLTMMRDCRLHLPEFNNSANKLNHVRTAFAFLTTILNLFISAFDNKSKFAVGTPSTIRSEQLTDAAYYDYY